MSFTKVAAWFISKVIQEFLDIVDVMERNHISKEPAMFVSDVTTESLRVALASVRSLITDLSKAAHYVLTGKLNQDSMEVSNTLLSLVTNVSLEDIYSSPSI